MSDHWKALADLLGTPALDRRAGESEAGRSPPSWKATEVPQGSATKPSEMPESKPSEPKVAGPKVAGPKVAEARTPETKAASGWRAVDIVAEEETVVKETVQQVSAGVEDPEKAEDRGSDQSSVFVDRSVHQQQDAAEKVSSVEDKNAANPNTPKRSGGWDALARLFGLSAPPPDADVPLPESKRPTESHKQAEAPKSPAATANVPVPTSKTSSKSNEGSSSAIDDLSQLGWSSPRSESKVAREPAGKEASTREPSSREPSSREPSSRERSSRDTVAKDAPREVREGRESRGDAGGRERSYREAGSREAGSREAGSREAGSREAGSRENGPRDFARGEDSRGEAGRDRNDRGRRGDRDQAGRDTRGNRDVPRDAGREGDREVARDIEPVRGERGPNAGERRSREVGQNRESPRGGDSRKRPDSRQPDSRQPDSRQPDSRQPEVRQTSEGRASESRRGEARPSPSRQSDTRSFDDRFVDDEASDVEDLSFGPARGRAERTKPAEGNWGTPLDPVSDEVGDEGGVPERRGRRRRGRRRGGADRAEGTQRPDADGRAEAPDHRGPRSESSDVRGKASGFGRPPAIDEAAEYEPEEVSHGEAGADEAPAVAGGEKRVRRRRRRGTRRPDAASNAAASDVESGELDLSEGYNLPSLLADEIEESEDDGLGHSRIPTWEETIRVLVTTNVEARHSPGSGGNKGGGGRNGGGHPGGHGRQGSGQGGGHGGRGRGGNRPSGGKR